MMLVFFFLMIRRPPGATRTASLFPSPSLCRSDAAMLDGFLAFHERVVEPALCAAGAPPLATLVSEIAANGYPRLPVREGETVLVRLAAFFDRSEEHTSELQSLMRISYAVFGLTQNITQAESTHSQVTTPH